MANGKYGPWITEEGLMKIRKWCEEGAEDVDLIQAMGITSSTFYVWLKRYPEMAEAITRGRGGACELIENALFQRARGGFKRIKKPVKRRMRKYDPETGKCILDEEIYEDREELVYITPDTQAIKFFLENKDPENWGRGAGGDEPGKGDTVEDAIKDAMARERLQEETVHELAD